MTVCSISDLSPLETVFVNLPNTKIELLYPYGDKSPIAGFLAKNKKGGIHHICIEVDNIRAAMKDCEEKGIRLLNKGTFFSVTDKS